MSDSSISAHPPAPQLAPKVVHDPLIRYGFYAALFLAVICLAFTLYYINHYSDDTTNSFERHIPIYLCAKDPNNLIAILGARTAQNKTLLQSCGVVAGIAFGFLGFALFLLGIKGTSDGAGGIEHFSFNFKRLAPGSLILLAAMALVGVSANHSIELNIGPEGARTGAVHKAAPQQLPLAPQTSPSAPIHVPHSDNSHP